MHRKSLTGEAKLNRDKAMLNDYIAGMHIAELAEKYGIGCTNVKKSLEVLEGFDAVRRNDRKTHCPQARTCLWCLAEQSDFPNAFLHGF